MKKRRETIEQLQAELDRHIHRCSKCGNYLLPDDDSPDIFCCPCCTIDNLQAQIVNLKAEQKMVICICGRVMDWNDENDFDAMGSESGRCCPDCGNEKFMTIEEIHVQLAIYKRLAEYGRHKPDCNPRPDQNKCACGYLQVWRGD